MQYNVCYTALFGDLGDFMESIGNTRFVEGLAGGYRYYIECYWFMKHLGSARYCDLN